MQKIILCPKCHVQAEKDNLGELLCPNCNARLCPKAHIFDGKICLQCGWEDPNYHLWQKAQKARAQSSMAEKSGKSLSSKPKYVCPKCGVEVDPALGLCPHCGFLYYARKRSVVQKPAVSATTAPVSRPPGATTMLTKSVQPAKSARPAPSQPSAPPRSPILREIAKAERIGWKFPSLKRFIRPVLASLLVAIVLGGLVMGGYYSYKFIREKLGQYGKEQNFATKVYTLRAIVSQEGGGTIRIEKIEASSTHSDQYQSGVEITLSSVELGSQITLTAIPEDRYIFDHWEGVSSSSETIIVTIDSDKSAIAYFKLKDTTPPEISGIEVLRITELCATVTWITDDLTTSQVEYGKMDVYSLTTPLDEKLTTSHSVRLTGLEPDTIYHFRVISKNTNQLQTTSIDRIFRTIYPQTAAVGNHAPDFALTRVGDNSTVVLSDFRGKRVLLNLWATGCTGCVLELPYIQDIHIKYADLAVITVCLDKEVERISNFVEEHPQLTFPILVNQPSITKGGYAIRIMPTTFFIDSDGVIREVRSGSFKSSEQIEEKLKYID